MSTAAENASVSDTATDTLKAKTKDGSVISGGHLVAKALKAEGVDTIFTLCGGHISPILKGAKDLGIRVIDVRHEATAVFAAVAVARISGIPDFVWDTWVQNIAIMGDGFADTTSDQN